MYSFVRALLVLCAAASAVFGAEEFVVSRAPDTVAAAGTAVSDADYRVTSASDTLTRAKPFVPDVPKPPADAQKKDADLENNVFLRNAIAQNTQLAENKGAGAPAVAKPTSQSASFFYDKPVPAVQAEAKAKDGFFFTPSESKEKPTPDTAAESKFYLRTGVEKQKEDDENPGFFSKAIKTVVDSVKNFNKDDEDEKEAPDREAINLQLISILEKQIDLLKSTGQTAKAAEATKELLDAYGEMTAALKAKKAVAK